MINLAGCSVANTYIKSELERARIPRVEVMSGLNKSEVLYSVVGKLGPFTFERAWYYWMVSGRIPLDIARELYADPVGKTDIRVDGNCTCPPPEKFVITSYHIDTEVGLRLFVDTLRKYKLVPE